MDGIEPPTCSLRVSCSTKLSYTGTAEVPGLEPRLPGPEPGGLPITPYLIGGEVFCSLSFNGSSSLNGQPDKDSQDGLVIRSWARRDSNPHVLPDTGV